MKFAVMSRAAALSAPALRSRKRTRHGMVGLATVCAMLVLIAMPARAASRVSAEEIAACQALSDHAADLIRAGQTVMSTRSQLRRCVRIQRAERRRTGQPADAGRN